ncbi:MAG TPA: Holliday junction branch migration DNA helicase RuvB, partial [Ignavibacteriaceae bacterium]|nr:Holliday junction branch migration DNA helicase RuvB [Ignavibacteriaceae bacterium]
MRKSTTTNAAATEEDIKIESSLRPKLIKEFSGQKKITDNLNVFVTAAKKRKEALDHVLLT